MKIVKIFIRIFVLVLVFFYFYPGFHAYRSQQNFISKWSENLETIHTIEELNQNNEKELLVTKIFNNGEWIVAISNDPQPGIPFALVMRDSNNYLYISTSKLSGSTVFKNDFNDIRANSLEDFMNELSKKYDIEKKNKIDSI